jgi:glyoxylase-like metal-dependent hydrolase (beta-lactamase superfamily II)
MAVQPTRIVEPGEMIGSLQVVAAPGHTPDHLAYFDQRDKVLIAGDAFQTLGGTAVSGTMQWRFLLPAIATWHKPTARQSAEKLVALSPNWLCVGHGKPLQNPQTAMRQAIQKA